MPYQLTRQETFSQGVKRVAREELKGALRSLHGEAEDTGSAVHDARKRFKKLRAVLRLVQSDLGKRRYRQLDTRFRDAGRALSELRDAEVLLTTLDALAERAGDRTSQRAFEGVRAALLARQRLAAAQTGEVTAETAEGMAALQQEVSSWPIGDHWRTVGPNLEREYGRGRKAFKAARQHPTDDRLHAWRKRVKDLWHHLRLLNPLWPQVIAEIAAQAGHLADLLGDEHDLAVLAQTLTKDAAFGSPEDVRTLLELIEGRRHELRGEAERLGHRLYAEGPGAFARRLERYWRVWRAESQEAPGTFLVSTPT